MELISICIAALVGYIMGRKLPDCVAAARDSDRQITFGSEGTPGRVNREASGPEADGRRRALLEEARDAGAIPKRVYDDLVEKLDRGVLNRQLAGVITEDSVECPWLQDLVAELWPAICQYVEKDILGELIEPMLQDILGPSIEFTERSLGDAVPQVGPLRATITRDSRGNGMELNVGLRYVSNCNIALRVGPVPVGVSNLSIVGTALVYLRPLVGGPIFLGGMEIAFLDPPEVELDFHGIGKVVEIPGLRSKIIALVVDLLGTALVLPNRIAFPIDLEPGAVFKPLLMCPEPQGIMRVTVHRAQDLMAADIAVFGEKSSDPYVQLTMGNMSRKTPYIAKTLMPVWSKDNVFDFPVHSFGQTLNFDVFDADVGSDDLLGHYRGRSIQKLLADGCKAHTVALEGGPGTLTFAVQWFDVLPEGVLVDENGVRRPASRPGKHDRTTRRRFQVLDEGSPEPLLLTVDDECDEDETVGSPVADPVKRTAKDAVILGAWFGSDADGGRWADVTERVCELQYGGEPVRANAHLLQVAKDPCPGIDKQLSVQYMIPSEPHMAMITVSADHIVGFKMGEATYKVRIEVFADSWTEPVVHESGWGIAEMDLGAGDRLEKQILSLEQDEKTQDEIATKLRIDLATVRGLLDKDAGMLHKYEAKQIEFEEKRAKLDDVGVQRMKKQLSDIRRQWVVRAEEDLQRRGASSEPHFDYAAHVLVPADWSAVKLTVVENSGRSICGLRFKSRANGGCLGLRRVVSGWKGSTGFYEQLDGDGDLYEERSDRVRSTIEGPFPLAVPEILLGEYGTMTDMAASQSKQAVLHGRVQILNLVPREPISYDMTLVVEVLQAKKLIVMDTSTRASDPYVRVRFGERVGGNTTVKKRTLAPVWKEQFEFPVDDMTVGDSLDFECYDDGLSGARFMGRCNFNPFTFIRRSAAKAQKLRQAKGWYVDPEAPPSKTATGWRKLGPRLRNEKDWELMRSAKGRTVSMGFGYVEIRVSFRGDMGRYQSWLQQNREELGDRSGTALFSDDGTGVLGHGAMASAERAVEEESETDVSDVDTEDGAAWKDDKEVSNCQRCNAVFTFTLRRHHCRSCGNIFCHHCSGNWLSDGPLKGLRVCTKCAQVAKNKNEQPIYQLLGHELATLYLDNFESGPKKGIADLKNMTQDDLAGYFDKIGVQGALHRQEIAGRIALFEGPGLPRRSVVIEILRGKQLIRQDTIASDPFVIVSYRGRTVRTPVRRNTLNPTWNSGNRWEFPLTSKLDDVELLVMDWDRTSKADFMGFARFRPMDEPYYSSDECRIVLDVRTSADGTPNRDDEIIRQKKGDSGEFPLGYLEVRVLVDDGGRPDLVSRPEDLSKLPLDSTWSVSGMNRMSTGMGSPVARTVSRASAVRVTRSPPQSPVGSMVGGSTRQSRETGPEGFPTGPQDAPEELVSPLTADMCTSMFDAAADGSGVSMRGSLVERLREDARLRQLSGTAEGRSVLDQLYQRLSAEPAQPIRASDFVALATSLRPAPPVTPASTSLSPEPADRSRALHLEEGRPASLSVGSSTWVDDSQRESCVACRKQFHMFRRRHHCRRCGDVFCKDCASSYERIEGSPDDGLQRVCVRCSTASAEQVV